MLGSTCSVCCDSCPPCEGSTCCGGEYPRVIGVCCENVWRLPAEGVCCDGVFYAAASEEQGDCCANIWYPVPEGQSPPDRTAFPFVPVSWETELCPAGTIYARWGLSGECCGCIPDEVFDPRAGEGSPPPGGMVPTETVVADLCCDTCPGPLYLPFDAYGQNIGCKGTCCADDDCSRLTEAECAQGVHPTRPNASHYYWRSVPCCGPNTCLTECCKDGDPIVSGTWEVTGEVVEGSEWVVVFNGQTYTYTATGADTTAGQIAAGLAALIPGATSQGSSLTVSGPSTPVANATLATPGGQPQIPDTPQVETMTFAECAAAGGTPRAAGRCPCQPGAKCCETAKSSGLGLTFHKPGTLAGTVRVTVTGTTTSPILVHGAPIGTTATPTDRCPFTHTFLLCHGSFNIEPVPCGSTFHNLDVEVCYEQEETLAESFNFSGCNGLTLPLGSCPYNCVTTLVYSGGGHTSNSTIVPYGDFVIEASGSGALVMTTNITVPPGVTCVDKITLSGTNTGNNQVAEINGAGVAVDKDGPGTWWFASASGFSGGFRLLNGTAIVADNVAGLGAASPLGTESLFIAGSGSGQARLLMFDADVSRPVTIEAGPGPRVFIGTAPAASYGQFGRLFISREVTLVAPAGGTAYVDQFDGTSSDIRIGHADFLGTVQFNGLYETTGTLSVECGTLELQEFAELTAALVKIHGGAELVHNATIPFIGPLEFTGTAGTLSGIGTVEFTSTVVVGGAGHEISAAVSLAGNTTISGSGSLLISGEVSGGSTLTQDGSGTVSLSGNNTYTGTTTINSGTMKAESLTAFGTGDIVVNAGGTLDKNGFAITNNITNNGGTVLN